MPNDTTTHDSTTVADGARAFIDEPVPDDELTDLLRSQKAINERLGFGGTPRRVVEQRWCDTKREARDWAWSRCKTAGATVAA